MALRAYSSVRGRGWLYDTQSINSFFDPIRYNSRQIRGWWRDITRFDVPAQQWDHVSCGSRGGGSMLRGTSWINWSFDSDVYIGFTDCVACTPNEHVIGEVIVCLESCSFIGLRTAWVRKFSNLNRKELTIVGSKLEPSIGKFIRPTSIHIISTVSNDCLHLKAVFLSLQ